MKHLRHVRRRARAGIKKAAKAVKRWWRNHRERITGEWGYAEAFTAVLLAAAELLTTSQRVRHVTRQLVAAYVALQRALSPRYEWSEDA